MQKYKQGKLRRNFFDFFKKSFSAALIVLMLGMQTSYAAITGDANFNTNVNTSGNTTEITGGIINNGTGFHHFYEFGLDNGQIANLLMGNANRFVNLVDGKVTINGLFNAMKNGTIGGDVIFVSPLGMIVGASGVMNVGSLQTITPLKTTYDSLVGLGSNISWDNIKDLRSDSTESETKIYGKIFARDKIDIGEARALTIAGKANLVSGFNDNGFAKTTVIGGADNIVNSQGIIDASYMDTSSGGIKIVAQNINTLGTNSVIQSAGDVNIDSTSNGGIALGSKIKAANDVNIGNIYSSAATHTITLNNSIEAGGAVNLKSSIGVNQKANADINAASLAINTSNVTLESTATAKDGINISASHSFTQKETSEITNTDSGSIIIESKSGNVVTNKITNQNGNIEVFAGALTLNDTLNAQNGDIKITTNIGNITQKDDSFDSLKTTGDVSFSVYGDIGSAEQSINIDAGGKVDITNNGSTAVNLNSKNSDLTVTSVSNATDINIESGKKLTVERDFNASNSITLKSQEGFVQNSGSTLYNWGSGEVSISNAASGNVEVNSIQSDSGNVNISNNASNSDIVLNNNIKGNNIVLNSQGGIQQTTADQSLTAGGNLSLNAKTDIGSESQHIVFSKEGTFSANTLGGVHLTAENTDISLGSIAAGIDYDIKTTGTGSVIFDKDLTDIKGDFKIETNKALNIDSAIRADGDVVLKTANGDIILNALITSVNESITLDAQGSIYQDAAYNSTALSAAKNIELLALTGDVGSSTSAIQLAAKGLVNVDGGNVHLQSPGSLNIAGINFGKENPNTVVNLKTTTSSDGDITFSGLVKGSDITVDSAQGIYQTNENDKTLEASGTLDLKTANGDIGETGKSIKFSSSSVKADSAGSVVLTGVNSDIRTSQIKSKGNIDLSTEVTELLTDKGKIIVEGDLSTTNGYIRLISDKTLDLNNDITASSYIHLAAKGGVNQAAGKTVSGGNYVTIENFNEGDINIGDVISQTGDINISNQASRGNIFLNSVLTSTTGSILVQTLGGNLIQNTAQNTASLVAAKDITINAADAGSSDKYIVVDAGRSFNANVNNIYAKNLTGDLILGAVNATLNANLTSEGSILQTDYTKDSIIAGESVNLKAANNIGLDADNGLAVSGSAKVNADAQNVYLASYGELNTGVINAENDLSIKGKSVSNGININDNITAGRNINISSMGAIAQKGGTIHKTGLQDGTVSISSSGGNINLKEVVNEKGSVNITNSGIGYTTFLESLITATSGDINITTNGDIRQTFEGLALSTDGRLNIVSQNHDIGESGKSLTFTASNGVSANAGTGSIYLSAINSDINTRDIISGKDIDLAVSGGNLLVSGELVTNNGYISLVTDKAVHIEHLISASEYIVIDANGAITQDSSLNLALNAGSGDITLNANGNDIGAQGNSLSLNAGGKLNADGSNIYVKSPGKDLNLNNINALGTVDIASETAGNLNIIGSVNGDDVTLTAADGIYQNTPGKKISAKGALSLTAQKESIGQTGNAINFSAGSVSANAEKSVVLLGEDTDINTASINAKENIDLSTVVTDPASDKGKITVANDLSTTNGYIRLDSAKALDINNNIRAGQYITLNANGGIVQNSGTSIAAGTASTVTDGSVTVTNKGSGGITLTDVSSNKGNITAINTEGADGDVSLGRVNAVDADINITNDAQNANIVLNNLVNTNSGSIKLNSKGGIIQNSAYNDVSLNSGNNLTLNAANDLGSASNKLKVNVENSLTAKGSNVYVDSPSKTLNIAGVDSAGTVNISTTNDGDINLGGKVSGRDIVLNAHKSIYQTIAGQTIDAAAALSLTALNGDIGASGTPIIFKAASIAAEALNGSIVLNGVETNINTGTIKAGNNLDLSTTTSGKITISNAIDTNGYIRLNSAEGLDVNNTLSAGDFIELGAVNDILLGAVVTSTRGDITLDSSAGSILNNNASSLLVSGRDITLNAAQNAGSIDSLISIRAGGTLNATAGNFYVENTQGDLTLGSVNANNDVKLISAGDIVQKTQDTSSVTAQGNVELVSTNGDIGKSASNALVVDVKGNVNTDSNNLWLTSSKDINTGTINADHAVNVVTTGSDKNIVIKEKITAADVSLTSSGSIKQDSLLNKTVETNNLTLIAQNGSIGETGNAIDFSATGNLDAAASEAVVLNGFGRDIDTSNITAGTSIDLSTEESGKIIVSSDLNAANGYIRLDAVDGLVLNNSNLTASEYVTLISQKGDILLNSIINAGTNITLDAYGSIIQGIEGVALNAGNSVLLSAIGDIGSAAQKITLNAAKDVTAQGANIYLTSPNSDLNLAGITTTGGNGTVDLSTLTAGNINIKGEITGNNVTLDAYNGIYQTSDEKTITAKGTLSLFARNNDIGASDKAVKFEAAAVNAQAPKGSVVLNGINTDISTNSIAAGKNIDLSTTGTGNISVAGPLTANGYIKLNSAENLTLNHNLTASDYIWLGAQKGINLSAAIHAASDVTIDASGNIIQSGGSISSTGGNVLVTGRGGAINLNDVSAYNDVNINGTGDTAVLITLGDISALNGNLSVVNDTGANIILDSVLTASNGDVSLNANSGNILQSNITPSVAAGGNVFLGGSSVGSSSQYIHVSSGGNVSADGGNIYLENSDAQFKIGNINSNAAITNNTVNLKSNNGDIIFNGLVKGNNVTVNSAKGIKQSTAVKAVEANTVNFIANNGTVGEADKAINLSVRDAVNVDKADSVYLHGVDASSSLNLGNINADNLVQITSAGGLRLNGIINALSANLTAQTNITQYNGLLDGLSIVAENINLVSNAGSIGEQNNAIGFKTNNLSASAIRGSVVLNGIESDINTNSIRAGKNIDLSTSISGNITISNALSTNDGYIRLNSAESLTVNDNVAASGGLTLNAQDGKVSMNNAALSGNEVSIAATKGIEQQGGSIVSNSGNVSIINNGTDNSDIKLSSVRASRTLNITNNAKGKVQLNNSIQGGGVNIVSHGGVEQTSGNIRAITSQGVNISNNDSGDINLLDVEASSKSVTITNTNAGKIKTGNIEAYDSISITNTEGSNGAVELGSLTTVSNSNNQGKISVSNLSKAPNSGIIFKDNVSGTDINIVSNGGITQTNGNITNKGNSNNITIINSNSGDIKLNNVTADRGSINIENSGSGGIITNAIEAFYNISISLSNETAAKDISLGTVTNRSNSSSNPVFIINKSGGDILLNGLVSTKSGSDITIDAGKGAIHQNIASLGIRTTGNLNLKGLGGIGTSSNFLKVNAGNVRLSGTDVYLEGTNSNLLISSIENAAANGVYNIRTTGAGSLTINDDIAADDVVLNSAGSLTANKNITAQNSITASGSSVSQAANSSYTAQNGDVNITASNGNIDLGGSVSSENSDVTISNNSVSNGSVTVNNINAGGSYNITNRANGLITVNGTLNNGGDSSILSSDKANSGIVLADSAVLNNKNGTLKIENHGQKGLSLGGAINNNIINGTVLEVINADGGLAVSADINNGITETASNIVSLHNSGSGGLRILSGLINNYGTLSVENSNGEMSLNGALDAQLGSINSFVNSSNSDFVVGMKLANYGNTITFENQKTGSLIVSEDAEISVFSTKKDGNVYTGVLNLVNSSSDGTDGGGITINGKINNGSAETAGGIVNITNSGNGSVNDYGITIGESALINNYSEMNIENASNNGLATGKIAINGTIKGDKGPVVSGTSAVPVPSGSIINIKNNAAASNSEIVFGSTANVDVKGNKLNITNDGGKGITIADGANVSNTDTVTVTNNKGSFNIEKNSALNSSGSVVIANKEAAQSVNVKGTLKGSNVELNSNASDVNIDGTVEGNNVTIKANDADVNIAHNSSNANIKANNDININVTNGNILNHSDTETAVENGLGIAAGGDMTLSADNIGALDSALDNILDSGFDLDTTKSINIAAGGTVHAASGNTLNLNAVSGNLNLGNVSARDAILSALAGSILGTDVSAANNMYLYAKADTGAVRIDNLSAGSKLFTEAGSDITINSMDGLDIETMLSRNGNINLETNGNTEIREIAAANDINIKVNDEKLTIIDLGRVKRNKNVIPKTINITVNDAKNPDKTTANGKLDIYNAYVQNKATLKADTITAQVYDISDTAVKGQKRVDKYGNEATGFHNANKEGNLLEFDIQGANYAQPNAGSEPHNEFYKPDASDKHALDVYITLGDSVGNAAYGANFKKLYSDRAFVDSINAADPSAHSKIVLESGIIGEKAVFMNNKLRLDINNSDTPKIYPIDTHYQDIPANETITNKTSFNMEMYDKIELNKKPTPSGPVVPEDVEHYNPNRIVNTPDYNKDISGVNRNDVNVIKKVESKDKENSITASDESTGLRNINWVIRNKDNQVIGASEFVAKPVINTLTGISKKGLKVTITNEESMPKLKKGDVLHIDMKYKEIAFNTDGKVTKIKDGTAEITFLNPDKLTETILNFLRMYNEDL